MVCYVSYYTLLFIEIISNCNNDFYLNVYELLTILLALPVTSCEAEMSFSTLKRIKT